MPAGHIQPFCKIFSSAGHPLDVFCSAPHNQKWRHVLRAKCRMHSTQGLPTKWVNIDQPHRIRFCDWVLSELVNLFTGRRPHVLPLSSHPARQTIFGWPALESLAIRVSKQCRNRVRRLAGHVWYLGPFGLGLSNNSGSINARQGSNRLRPGMTCRIFLWT
jgi:hypothetical protein